MPNSMDIILVRFNRSETKFHSPSTACFEMPRLPKEFCCNGDTITLPEFLKIQPKDLTAEERKIQTALTRLYELNDREPPLFQSFPNWRNEKFPLTIDTTYIPEDQSCLASYNPEYNRITFEETNDPIILLESLAHELKHAEHCSREVYNLIGQHHDLAAESAEGQGPSSQVCKGFQN